MSLDPSTVQDFSTTYDIQEYYKADARAGADMLNAAKFDFLDEAAARDFLKNAVLNPHKLTELNSLASSLYYDMKDFYSVNARVGSVMLETAKTNFKKDVLAKKFLGKAAAQPHQLPELAQLAASLFWETQQNFFYSLIRNYPKKDYEDLMMAMAEGFLKWLPKYDADNFQPGTFFKTRVLHYAYEEVIKINELVPEHKIHTKRMLLMYKEALLAEGKAVTAEALLAMFPEKERGKTIDVNDIKELLPFLGDDGASLSLDTLGDGGAIADQFNQATQTPEDLAMAKDKQQCFADALKESFTGRELNILIIYNDTGLKITETKNRLENLGFEDVSEDEIRKVWREAASRIHAYTLKHPESASYFGNFIKLYAKQKSISEAPINTEEQADQFYTMWDITVGTIVSDEPGTTSKKIAKKSGKNDSGVDGQMGFVLG